MTTKQNRKLQIERHFISVAIFDHQTVKIIIIRLNFQIGPSKINISPLTPSNIFFFKLYSFKYFTSNKSFKWYQRAQLSMATENTSPPPPLPPTSISSTPKLKSLVTFTLKISEKLDGKNFLVWCQQVEPMISVHNLQSFIIFPEQFLSASDHDTWKENPLYRN